MVDDKDQSVERPRAREHLILLLKRNGAMSAQSLSELLGITPVAVRKHLDVLERDGFVQPTAQKQARGRPQLIYKLTPMADSLFPQGYRQLSLELINELVELDGVGKLSQLLEAGYERMMRDHKAALLADNLAGRVEQLARLRNADGYMVTIEESPNAFTIHEHNCPIIEVASKFPVACQCEQHFFSQVFNEKTVRESSIVDGDDSCTYRIPK
jgi:predicted ArsR family transcriptional regulator